jgi:hypothetical protein
MMGPEHVFFDSADYGLEPPAGVETGDCLEGINRLFARLPSDESSMQTEADEPFEMPHFDAPTEHLPESRYILQIGQDEISALIDNNPVLSVVDEEQAEDEHKGLVELWDELKLSPVTRLQLAAKLCGVVGEDNDSDYQFQIIMGATMGFKRYNAAFEAYRNVLTYEPEIVLEESGRVQELAMEYKLAEDAFRVVNKEIVGLLGAEIITENGAISELLDERTKKIQDLKMKLNLDHPRMHHEEGEHTT